MSWYTDTELAEAKRQAKKAADKAKELADRVRRMEAGRAAWMARMNSAGPAIATVAESAK